MLCPQIPPINADKNICENLCESVAEIPALSSTLHLPSSFPKASSSPALSILVSLSVEPRGGRLRIPAGARLQFQLRTNAVVSVQINQIIFGQIIKPAQAPGGSRLADGVQRAILGVGQIHGTLLDQARELVPQCRFWLFSLWIHGRTHEPGFARGVSANAKLGPSPVFVNGNHFEGGE